LVSNGVQVGWCAGWLVSNGLLLPQRHKTPVTAVLPVAGEMLASNSMYAARMTN
jgi:hypothetical protein